MPPPLVRGGTGRAGSPGRGLLVRGRRRARSGYAGEGGIGLRQGGDRRRRPEARSYLADELDGCAARFPRYLADRAFSVEWIDTIVEAWVTVSVTEADQGIFGSYRPETYEFRLSPAAGGWRITHQEWPWYECSADSILPKPKG